MRKLLSIENPHKSGSVNLCWQGGSGSYLATTGTDNTVAIHNKGGKLVDRITLPNVCVSLCWDRDGDMLSVIVLNCNILFLWDSNTCRKQTMDCGLRDYLSCIFWSKTGPLLAIGTTKGNLCIYNHVTSKRIPIIGKHSKAITCGSWNSENLLALGSDDRTLSISNSDGDTLKVISLRAEPSRISFSEMKSEESYPGENTVSVIVGKRTLYLYNLQDSDNPVELAFQSRYGYIVTYHWYGDGYVLVGFSEGFLVAISTHMEEIGHELFQSQNHKACPLDIAISMAAGKVATCGDETVKIHELRNLSETESVVPGEIDISTQRIAWSSDGQILAAATSSGSIVLYLSKLPMLASSYQTTVAILTSLSDVTVYSYASEKNVSTERAVLSTNVEPSVLRLSRNHLAIGMNNCVWFYSLDTGQDGDNETTVQFLFEREYSGNVTDVRLNDTFAAVLFKGMVHLHSLLTEDSAANSKCDKSMKTFPEVGEKTIITFQWLGEEFLIYATDNGRVRYFHLEEWKLMIDFKHENGVTAIYPNHLGTFSVLVDSRNNVYLFNAVTETLLAISKTLPNVNGVLWELWNAEDYIFATFDHRSIYIYAFVRFTVEGDAVKWIGEASMPQAHLPLFLNRGCLLLETPSGKLFNLLLRTHQTNTSPVTKDQQQSLRDNLDKAIALLRLDTAWDLCMIIDNSESWIKLAHSALHLLDIEMAIRVYSHLENVGMVASLEELDEIEETNLLSAQVYSILGDYDKAQTFYLNSSKPIKALHLREDLLQWDLALELAKNLAPHRIPHISKEYALQLEYSGHFEDALKYYEKSLDDAEKISKSDLDIINAGLARMNIRVGDHRKALVLIRDVENMRLKEECATIFENTKKLNEAAALYKEVGNINSASSCYIRTKNWSKISELLPKITSHKILMEYAKAMEATGQYRNAVASHLNAKDPCGAIRILLERMKDTEKAVEVFQDTRSIEGAKLIAAHYQQVGDTNAAIKYLVISSCYEEAFKLALESDSLEYYADTLLNNCAEEETASQFKDVAQHFEANGNTYLAGKFYFHAKRYREAAKFALESAKNDPHSDQILSLLIDICAASFDQGFTNKVISLLLGEKDEIYRQPKYLFRLYMAKRLFKEASKTAVLIANEEQTSGNYRYARDLLFTMYAELRANKIQIGAELTARLCLLHSYILARIHVKMSEHVNAALLLLRIANNISKFPAHIVPILTSVVIECQRADMKASAFKYASVLMKNEYRGKIDEKYRKTIEGIIRRAPLGDDLKDAANVESSPCPFCEVSVACTQLTCQNCNSEIPFCVASGWHVTKEGMTRCPHCDFPAIYDHLVRLANFHHKCPMCNESLNSETLQLKTTS